MKCIAYQLPSSGQWMTLHVQNSAKKNIIMRPIDAKNISLNIPKWLQEHQLILWLNSHENIVLRTLSIVPTQNALLSDNMIQRIWYRGRLLSLMPSENPKISIEQNQLLVPIQQNNDISAIGRFLYQEAHDFLLPRLWQHANRLHLRPKAVALSRAKTFWGVCRHSTGIRLNWRLVGAPDEVSDYVCVHELCHLTYANHGREFWHLVNQHTPHTAWAKDWLKQHGRELFALG